MAAFPTQVRDPVSSAALNQFVPDADPLRNLGRAVKRSRVGEALPRVSSQEQGALECDKLQAATAVLGAAAGPVVVGAPPWFAPAFAAAFPAAFAAVFPAGATLAAQLANLHAVMLNSTISDGADPLTPLTTAAGVVPPGFPATNDDLGRLTGPQLAALLGAYGLAAHARIPQNLHRLRRHLGIRR